MGKKFIRDGSHCTTGENQKGGRSRCATWEKIVKELGRCGSHFATRDEFACSEVACQDWVPLCHKGESGEELGPIVPVGKNS